MPELLLAGRQENQIIFSAVWKRLSGVQDWELGSEGQLARLYGMPPPRCRVNRRDAFQSGGAGITLRGLSHPQQVPTW